MYRHAKKKQNRNVLCIDKPCNKRNKIGMFLGKP